MKPMIEPVRVTFCDNHATVELSAEHIATIQRAQSSPFRPESVGHALLAVEFPASVEQIELCWELHLWHESAVAQPHALLVACVFAGRDRDGVAGPSPVEDLLEYDERFESLRTGLRVTIVKAHDVHPHVHIFDMDPRFTSTGAVDENEARDIFATNVQSRSFTPQHSNHCWCKQPAA